MTSLKEKALKHAIGSARYEATPEQILEAAHKFLEFLTSADTTAELGTPDYTHWVYYADERPCDGAWPADTYIRRFEFESGAGSTGEFLSGAHGAWRADPGTRGYIQSMGQYKRVRWEDLPDWATK